MAFIDSGNGGAEGPWSKSVVIKESVSGLPVMRRGSINVVRRRK
jgi:hypothetical protein